MVLVLAAIYGGFVWLIFYKFRLMEFTRTRKIIVIAVGVITILAILFTIQRTAPMTSNLRVSAYVIPLGSRSGGRVTKVYVQGSQPVKVGDKLFEVDTDPYQYDVEGLKGSLVDTRQKAQQLTPTLDSAKASVIQRQKDMAVAELGTSQTEKDIAQARDAVTQSEKNVEVARLGVKQREVDLSLAQSTLERMQKSFDEGAVSAQDLDSAKAKRDVSQEALKQAAGQQAVAELSLQQAIRRVGHFLGGPKPENRTALAISTSSRHPGVAIAIAAANFPEEKLATAAVLLYLLVGAVASIPYHKWMKRQQPDVENQVMA